MDEPTPKTSTPFESISLVLAWLSKRAAPLTAIVFAIAAMLWSDFRREFGLPIAFSSGSSLTALPAIAAIVCAAVATITVLLLTPAQVLTVQLYPGGARLADVLPTPIDTETGVRGGRPKLAKAIEWYWLVCAVVSGLAWAGAIAWASLHQSDGVGWQLAMLLLPVLQTAGATPILLKASGNTRKASLGFYGLLLGAHLMQSFIAFSVVYALLQSLHTVDAMELTVRGIYVVAVLFIIALFQLVVALRVVRGWYANFPKHVVCLGLALLAFVSLLQPVGARLTAPCRWTTPWKSTGRLGSGRWGGAQEGISTWTASKRRSKLVVTSRGVPERVWDNSRSALCGAKLQA